MLKEHLGSALLGMKERSSRSSSPLAMRSIAALHAEYMSLRDSPGTIDLSRAISRIMYSITACQRSLRTAAGNHHASICDPSRPVRVSLDLMMASRDSRDISSHST